MNRTSRLAVACGMFGAVVAGCGGHEVGSRHTPEAHGNSRGAEGGAAGESSEPAPAGTAPVPAGSQAPAAGVSPYCPSAGFRSADQVVAAGIVGHDLVLVTAGGERRVAASFHPSGPEESLMGHVTTADGRITASLENETIRLRADFSVLYRLPVYSDIVSDAGVPGYRSTSFPNGSFIRADGTVVTFADATGPVSAYVQEPPDGEGWMLASWSAPDSTSQTIGLANVDGRLRPFFTRPGDVSYSKAKLAGQYVYLHGKGSYTLTFATSSGVVDVPMDIPGLPGTPATYLVITGSDAVGLVHSAYDSRLFRVDASERRVTPIEVPAEASDAVAAGVGGGVIVAPDGGAFLGIDNHGRPLWRYDAARDRITPVSLDDLAPLHPMDGAYCNPPSLVLPGAGVGIGLRDDATGGFYVLGADGSRERIGRPVRNVMKVAARQIGGAWIITSDDGRNTYCPGFLPFAEDPSGLAVTGNSVQIVPPVGEPLVFTTKDEWTRGITEIERGGMCALREADGAGQESTVYDLGTHAATPFGSFRAFAWLP